MEIHATWARCFEDGGRPLERCGGHGRIGRRRKFPVLSICGTGPRAAPRRRRLARRAMSRSRALSALVAALEPAPVPEPRRAGVVLDLGAEAARRRRRRPASPPSRRARSTRAIIPGHRRRKTVGRDARRRRRSDAGRSRRVPAKNAKAVAPKKLSSRGGGNNPDVGMKPGLSDRTSTFGKLLRLAAKQGREFRVSRPL